ncbi:MAG: stage II sporulation protein M [Methanimicrococcus sp.]|nr:stage II sporulation protein M [Methanimicrococcus sp.]
MIDATETGRDDDRSRRQDLRPDLQSDLQPNLLPDLKDESRGSNFSEAGELPVESKHSFAESDAFFAEPEHSLVESDDSFAESDASFAESDASFAEFDDFDADLYDDVADDFGDDFAGFEGESFIHPPPAAAQKKVFSLKESLKNFSYPRWLKSVLPQYFKPTLWMTVLFIAAAVLGYFAGQSDPEIFETVFSSLGIPDGSSFDLFLFIFFNNAGVLFMLILFGFVFAILPVLVVLVNGSIIGLVSEASLRQFGLPFLLAGLLPHGIIELPVILIGAGIGFKLGALFTRLLLNMIKGNPDVCSNLANQFKKEFLNAAGLYFLFLLPLLLIAAFIEVYVTMPLLGILF